MAKSTVPIELPGDPTADLQATTKLYVDTGLAGKPGMPFIGSVPTGSTTPTITHGLGTADVDVTVYRVADGVQVGVPADRVDANNVQLTFTTIPTSGEYRVVVSAGTGAGGPGGGGGGTPDPHAATHATAGSDPLTPAAIGAATSDHDHSGVYAPVVHNHSGTIPQGGITGQVLTKDTNDHYDVSWQDPAAGGGGASSIKPYPPILLTIRSHVSATNGFTYSIVEPDAALGTHFRIDMTSGSCSVRKPFNPTAGQSILFEIRALGGNRDCFFPVGTVGGGDFAGDWTYGDTAVGTTIDNTVDFVVVVYDERAASGTGRWRILSVSKGFPA